MKETRNSLNINVRILTKGNSPINKQSEIRQISLIFWQILAKNYWPHYHGNGYENEGMMHDLRVLAWKQTIMESFVKICDYAWTTRFDGYRKLVLISFLYLCIDKQNCVYFINLLSLLWYTFKISNIYFRFIILISCVIFWISKLLYHGNTMFPSPEITNSNGRKTCESWKK